MAVRRKIFIPNEIYFITFTILGWKHIFINDKYCSLVYKWFDYMREKYDNKIYGYVIMSNHIHCLIKITDRSPKLSIFITNAKRFLAYQKTSHHADMLSEILFFNEKFLKKSEEEIKMNQAQNFKVGDEVLWNYYYAKIIIRGTVEWIENNLMGIRIPDEGKFKFSKSSARKIDGQWLVHRSYQGYKEPLYVA